MSAVESVDVRIRVVGAIRPTQGALVNALREQASEVVSQDVLEVWFGDAGARSRLHVVVHDRGERVLLLTDGAGPDVHLAFRWLEHALATWGLAVVDATFRQSELSTSNGRDELAVLVADDGPAALWAREHLPLAPRPRWARTA